MAKLSLRVDFEPCGRVGPGKIALLERILSLGSIAAAGRSMGMSYRRAWELVLDLNKCFKEPVVETRMGGNTRGGASLTAFGRDIVARYRSIADKASAAVAGDLAALQTQLAVPAAAEPAHVPDDGRERRRPVGRPRKPRPTASDTDATA